MENPLNPRRIRWLDQCEALSYAGEDYYSEDTVLTLLDREVAFERKRVAGLLCNYCRTAKPRRDRDTNTFVHEIYVQESPGSRVLQTVVCYADLIWRNEDQ